MKEVLSHLNIPSPVSKVETEWSIKHGINLWVKRDDLIHPIVSGNKWRKLSEIIKTLDFDRCKSISTYGGAYSNHLIATANVCSILRVPSVGYVRGEKPIMPSEVLTICEAHGMQLEYLSRSEYNEVKNTYGYKNNSFFIPEGGACDMGAIGCKQIVSEVEISKYSHIFVSCGTGTTIVGMCNYILKQKEQPALIGVQVLKGKNYIQNMLREKYNMEYPKILDKYHTGGYAKMNNELIDFCRSFLQETGIMLDPIYTGKMILAIKKELEEGNIEPGSRILAIHTGGLTGWFGKYKELNASIKGEALL